jgi:hypothetical protein
MRLFLQRSSCIFTHFRWFRHKPSLAYVSFVALPGQRILVNFPRTVSLTMLVQFSTNPSGRAILRGFHSQKNSSFKQGHQGIPARENPSSFSFFHFLCPSYKRKTNAKRPTKWCGPRAHIPFRFWASDGGFSERRVLVSQSIGPNTPPCSTMRSSSMTPTTQWPSRRPVLHSTQRC